MNNNVLTKEFLNSIQIIPLLDTLRLQKIDDEEYFSEKYSNYISNSRLGLINPEQDNDPKAFFEGLSKHSKYSDALIFGSAVHELTLQPELFYLCSDVDRPTAKMGFMCDELYNIWIRNNFQISDEDVIKISDKIDYYKGKMTPERIQAVKNAGKLYWDARIKNEKNNNSNLIPIYLDVKSRERVNACINSLSKSKKIQDLLHPKGIIEDPISENEQAILMDVEVRISGYNPFKLKLKSKLDNYTIDKESNIITVNDVKTIGKILSEFPNNFNKFHYSRELGLYSWLLSLCAKKYYGMDDCTIKSNCLVVSTIPQYYSKVYEVTRKNLLQGFNEFKYLLRLVAYYTATQYKDFGIWI
jgi:hypothetical protein